MEDEAKNPRPPGPRRRRSPTVAGRMTDFIEESFERARERGSPADLRAWTDGIEAITRRHVLFKAGPGAVEALREMAAVLRFQLARAPARFLRGPDSVAPALCTFARSLEPMRDPGLTRRANGLLAMLGGRLGLRGWTGRADTSLLDAFDRVTDKLIHRPDPLRVDAWLLLVQAAYASPESMSSAREFYRSYARRMLASARAVPTEWLAASHRFGSYLERLAEGLVRTRDAELTAFGCEIAESVAGRLE